MSHITQGLNELTDQVQGLKDKVCQGAATPDDLDPIIRKIWDIKTCVANMPTFRKKKKKKKVQSDG